MEVLATRGGRSTGTPRRRGGTSSPHPSRPGAARHHPPAASKTPSRVSTWFTKVAGATANAMGTPWSFLIALGIIILWAVSGPLFGFSDTWQLVINTGTTIVTFLMVFLIQNTQNRDAKALHLKLDELLRAVESARNDLIDIEQAPDEDMAAMQDEYREIREQGQIEGTPPLPERPPAQRGEPGPSGTSSESNEDNEKNEKPKEALRQEAA